MFGLDREPPQLQLVHQLPAAGRMRAKSLTLEALPNLVFPAPLRCTRSPPPTHALTPRITRHSPDAPGALTFGALSTWPRTSTPSSPHPYNPTRSSRPSSKVTTRAPCSWSFVHASVTVDITLKTGTTSCPPRCHQHLE